MRSELKAHLAAALADAEFEFSRFDDDWSTDRRDYCAMWSYVISSAPDPIVVTAAKQIAHYFHPKAEINIPSELKSEVGALALGLISPEHFQSYQSLISAYVLKRLGRVGLSHHSPGGSNT